MTASNNNFHHFLFESDCIWADSIMTANIQNNNTQNTRTHMLEATATTVQHWENKLFKFLMLFDVNNIHTISFNSWTDCFIWQFLPPDNIPLSLALANRLLLIARSRLCLHHFSQWHTRKHTLFFLVLYTIKFVSYSLDQYPILS